MGTLVHRLERMGEDPSDPSELRAQKRVLVVVSFVVAVLAVGWGAVYLAFDEPLAAAIPWTYTAAVSVSLVFFAVTNRYVWFRFTQLLLILLLPFLLQLALGGFVNASAVIIWSLLANPAQLPAPASSGSGSALAPQWRALLAGRNSSTTCGASRSTLPAAWRPTACRAGSR